MRTVHCQICGERLDAIFVHTKADVLVGWHKKSDHIKVEYKKDPPWQRVKHHCDSNSCEGSGTIPLEVSSRITRFFLGDLKGRIDNLRPDSVHRYNFQKTIDHLEKVLQIKTEPSSLLLAYIGWKSDLPKHKKPDINKEEGWHPEDSTIDPGLVSIAESYVAREPIRTPGFLRQRFNLGWHANQNFLFSVEDFNDYAYPRFTEFTNGLQR